MTARAGWPLGPDNKPSLSCPLYLPHKVNLKDKMLFLDFAQPLYPQHLSGKLLPWALEATCVSKSHLTMWASHWFRKEGLTGTLRRKVLPCVLTSSPTPPLGSSHTGTSYHTPELTNLCGRHCPTLHLWSRVWSLIFSLFSVVLRRHYEEMVGEGDCIAQRLSLQVNKNIQWVFIPFGRKMDSEDEKTRLKELTQDEPSL
jgi:hypothetical protein